MSEKDAGAVVPPRGPDAPRENASGGDAGAVRPRAAGALDIAPGAPPGKESFVSSGGADEGGTRPQSLEEASVEVVRGINRQGRGASVPEVLSALAGQGVNTAAPDAAGRVEAALVAHPGISSFEGLGGGQVYHDPSLVSATYARILDRKSSPLRLMAEEIRHNSREYPRPVPIELFEASPFSLTPEEIGEALPAMAENSEYADIACAMTSDGALYLYSTLSLEPAYAEFLAEHARNLARNP